MSVRKQGDEEQLIRFDVFSSHRWKHVVFSSVPALQQPPKASLRGHSQSTPQTTGPASASPRCTHNTPLPTIQETSRDARSTCIPPFPSSRHPHWIDFHVGKLGCRPPSKTSCRQRADAAHGAPPTDHGCEPDRFGRTNHIALNPSSAVRRSNIAYRASPILPKGLQISPPPASQHHADGRRTPECVQPAPSTAEERNNTIS